MAMLPVDASTISTLAVICAALVFVFAFSSGMKPAAALLVAVVVGFVLKAIGIIPIGFMAVAIFSLVVGIFKNWVNQNEKNNSSVVDSETYEVERFNPKIETRETIEQGFNEPSNPIHTEPKKPLSKTNISLHFGFIVGWVVIISLVVYSLVKQNNDNSSDYQPTYPSNNSSQATLPVAPTVTSTTKLANTPVSQANQEAILMQKCDTFAVEHSRKSLTLTTQERKDDYDKLYNSCLAEERKPVEPVTSPIVSPAQVDSELLQTYQAVKIDNDNSRRLINDTWDRLPEQSRSVLLKEQRAWVKSKQKICGKIDKNKSFTALSDDELQAEIILLKCDTNANLQRVKLFSNATDEVGQLIKNSGK